MRGAQPDLFAYMNTQEEDLALLKQLLEIYDQKQIAAFLAGFSSNCWTREAINRWVKGKAPQRFTEFEYKKLAALLPQPRPHHPNYEFRFIDLFAGIGGIRRGFEEAGGQCVFTSEWNEHAIRTYKANYFCDPASHSFNTDIRKVTLSEQPDVSEQAAYAHINKLVPDHEVLLAGFPCQPFSIAGVSKKNSLGRAHGFECATQGTLFFDVARILAAKRPAAFVLENVKNLKSHDKGRTFKVIVETLEELGYWVADLEVTGVNDPKIIDGQYFVPQHRERVVLVGFRRDLAVHEGFSLVDIASFYPKKRPTLSEVLDDKVDEKYVLTPKLWEYLYNYAIKHKAKGNGFGYGLVRPNQVARTLSARYYKDGSEILIDRGFDTSRGLQDAENMKRRPRRLTPVECARLMGYSKKGNDAFRIPVSDTQAYKQFGNSVVVPVFAAVAKLMKPRILLAKSRISGSDPIAA